MLEFQDEVYDFGRRLRDLRKKAGLSQAKAAEKVGISKNSLYRYENNLQEPTLKTLVNFAICYRTSLDYIAGLENAASIRVRGLTKEQERILRDFVICFIEK